MRLIDADELDIYDVSPAYGMCVMGVTQEDIDDAPTVDAIPVEWIEQHFGSMRIAQMIIESWRAENEND